MTFVPCKAAELKEGDRVRVTLEGAVILGDPGDTRIHFRGSPETCTAMWPSTLDAGKLEREERPLQVGDRVRDMPGSHWEVVAPPRARDGSRLAEVCVWSGVHGYNVLMADCLERVS